MSNGSHRCEMKNNQDTREDSLKLPNVKESVFTGLSIFKLLEIC